MWTRRIVAITLFATLTFPAALAAVAGDEEWTWLRNPPGGQDLFSFGAAGDVVLAGYRTGMVRSDNLGQSWEPVDDLDGLPEIASMATLPDQSILAGDLVGRVFRTEDGGETWTLASQPAPGQVAVEIFADLQVTYMVTVPPDDFDGGRLWRSANRGDTWTEVATPAPPFTIHARGERLILGTVVGGGGGGEVYRSTDGAGTWTRVVEFFILPPGRISESGGALFADYGQQIHRSDDDGATWTPLDGAPEANLLAADGDRLFAYDNLTAHVTDDQGETWQLFGEGLEPSTRANAFFQHGGHLFVGGAHLKLQISPTDRAAWEVRTNGIPFAHVFAMTADSDHLYANPAAGEEVWRFDPGSGSWTGLSLGHDQGPNDLTQIYELWADGDRALFAGTQTDGIFRSTDDGETWQEVNAGVAEYNGTAGMQFREIEGFARHGQSLFAGTGVGLEFFNQRFNFSGAGVLRSNDGGTSWHLARSGLPIVAFNNFNEPVFDPIHVLGVFNGVILAGHFRHGVYRSTNNGSSWSNANGGLPSGISVRVLAFAELDGEIYFGGFINNFATVWKSADGGQSWQPAGSGLPQATVNDLAVRDGVIYAAVGFDDHPVVGVFQSTDRGATWTRAGMALDGRAVRQLETLLDGRLIAGTARRSTWALQGPAIEADITDLRILDGAIIAGAIEEIRESDDAHLVTEARVTGEAAQPHLLRLRITAETAEQDAQSLTITVEGRITDVEAQTTLLLRDWINGRFVEVDQFAMRMTESAHVTAIPDASRFIRAANGLIRLEIKQIVILPFTLSGFNSFFDQFEIAVR